MRAFLKIFARINLCAACSAAIFFILVNTCYAEEGENLYPATSDGGSVGWSGSWGADDGRVETTLPDTAYTPAITAIIKKNWTFPGMADRSGLVVVVRVTLSTIGEITAASIEKTSGRADFDASVLAAIQRSNGQLPPPPNSSLQDLRLTFREAE